MPKVLMPLFFLFILGKIALFIIIVSLVGYAIVSIIKYFTFMKSISDDTTI